jgi:hypothetical protein
MRNPVVIIVVVMIDVKILISMVVHGISYGWWRRRRRIMMMIPKR